MLKNLSLFRRIRDFVAGQDPIDREELQRLSGSRSDNIGGICASSPSPANLDASINIPEAYHAHEVCL